MQTTIDQLNRMNDGEFRSLLGGIFEKSPWIADAVCGRKPFDSVESLHAAMCATVENAGADRLLALLRAHPDLAARLEELQALTPESLKEQTSSGLLDMPEAEMERLRTLNAAYRERFGFPFIICARLNSTGTILASIAERMNNPIENEKRTAWQEVQKIALLRLRDLFSHS